MYFFQLILILKLTEHSIFFSLKMPQAGSRRKDIEMSNTVDLYQLKLKHAKRLIDIHNYLRKPTLNDNRVVYENFIGALIGIGGISDEMLQQIQSTDLQWPCGLPILMARRMAEIFQAESLDRLVELEEDSDVRIARQMRDTQAKEVTHGAL